jgi:hypothetical protein
MLAVVRALVQAGADTNAPDQVNRMGKEFQLKKHWR